MSADCDKWRQNPLVNPKTGRKIKQDGPTYIALQKECNQGKKPKQKQASQSEQVPRDRLSFFSGSKDVAPGAGKGGEVVADPSKYTKLGKIKDWRKVLSNFHMCPFEYNHNTYNTIEHVFQARKIALVDPEKAHWFTLESQHAIGQGDGLIARKNRKLVVLDNHALAQWNKKKDKVMRVAAKKKYMACEEARAVLKATNDAELWHIMPRAKPVRFEHLEQIRESL